MDNLVRDYERTELIKTRMSLGHRRNKVRTLLGKVEQAKQEVAELEAKVARLEAEEGK